MTLGNFGGAGARFTGLVGGGGSASAGDLLEEARQALTPSPEGMPLLSHQVASLAANYAENLALNGSFESWSNGTTSAPDAWTLTGAGATIARSTSTPRHSKAEVVLTAALNTATDLAQIITISATENVQLRGQLVTFSVPVKASTASRVFVRLDDGVLTKDSRFHVGDGAYELLPVSMVLDAAATKLEYSIEISSGASIAATFDAAKLELGATPTIFIPNIRDPFLQPRYTSAPGDTTITGAGSTAYTVMDSMTLANVVVDGTQSVLVFWLGLDKVDTADDTLQVAAFRGTTQLGIQAQEKFGGDANDVNRFTTHNIAFLDIKPAAGVYSYTIQWAQDNSAAIATNGGRLFLVAPIPTA